MNRKVITTRDPYAFSLGAFSMVGSFMMPVALSDQFINTAIAARLRQTGEGGQGWNVPNWDSASCLVHPVDLPCDCQAA